VLHACKVFAASRGLQAEDVFHHEHPGLEVRDVAQVFEKEQPARIVFQPFAVV
jgi:hypothetical protein